jgi:hypothetical protein
VPQERVLYAACLGKGVIVVQTGKQRHDVARVAGINVANERYLRVARSLQQALCARDITRPKLGRHLERERHDQAAVVESHHARFSACALVPVSTREALHAVDEGAHL